MQDAKAADKIAADSQHGNEFIEAGTRTLQENFVRSFRWRGQGRFLALSFCGDRRFGI